MKTKQRNELIISLIAEGKSLSEVQKTLIKKDVKMTYLDLRLIVADLEVNWQEPTEKTKGRTDGNVGEEKTKITIDDEPRKGAMISGKTIFKSGVHAEWWMDHMRQLGLDSDREDLITEHDMEEFQIELQKVLQSKYKNN